ncbi:MAG: hypothetical protein IT545_02820 [Rhodobacteraceae bacterium]|nr:hypothetical protein [Paracoccaceae bacterium]
MGLLAAALVLLAACAASPPAPPARGEGGVDGALASYETGWPGPLRGLGLPAQRDYVALLHVAPLRPIDLADPERARVTLQRAIFDPLAVATGKTAIGHLIVAWQCGGRQGMASQTGESRGQGLRMAADGWGVAAVLSTFTDGRVLTPGETSWRHLTVLGAGRGNVLAVEVDARACARLRAGLARWLGDPAAPARRFGLLLDPARGEGAGCLSFGLWLAGEAGVLTGAGRALRRSLAVHAAIVGHRARVPPATLPEAPAGAAPGTRAGARGDGRADGGADGGDGDRIVSLAALRRGPWDAGPVVERISVVDGELIFAAVTALRAGAGARPGWREARALAATDPAVAAAIARTRDWAAAWPVRRIADPGGVAALVLERR